MTRPLHIFGGALLVSLAPPLAAAERGYSVSDFERIRVSGPYRVEVVTDRSTIVKARGSTQALDRVIIDVQGRTLLIRPNRTSWAGGQATDTPPALIFVRAPALREASIAGSGTLSLSGLKGLRVVLGVEGSGTLTANGVAADRLEIGVIGTGRLVTTGTARQATVTSRGAAAIDAGRLSVDDLTITWESAGDGQFAARRTAKATSVGAGNVVIGGQAACTVNALGSGTVACGR